jgi:adenylate cyclase
MPALEAMMEILVLRRILGEVTRIYLGNEPHERILAGDVRRGELTHITSAMMFADMRGFTSVSMGLAADKVVELLNHYYDCVVGPVEAHGGEVLKFIGDGVLAIFRVREGEEIDACARALVAAGEALAAVARLNEAGSAPAPFSAGIGLHFGDAAYGNVGSGQRQDYTVIGRDVNIASRIAGLCGTLNKPLLLSAELVAHLPDTPFADLGEHELKGVAHPRPVFEPV